VVLEGSSRTRANIVTYRSPGSMQSSIQNFPYGQLNFQSSIQQATLNGAVNVFVTAGFGGLDISDLAAFGVGALAGGLVGGPLGALGGGIGAVVANNEALQDTNPLNPSHEDGLACAVPEVRVPPGRRTADLGVRRREWAHYSHSLIRQNERGVL
jgi:hypothetical protein